MKLQDTLTKENFWNEMMALYPKATNEFCEWIDEYKKAVNWSRLFNWNGLCGPLPRFHDIPYAMQQGIWIEFANQKLNEHFEQPEYFYSMDLEEDIKVVLSEIENNF